MRAHELKAKVPRCASINRAVTCDPAQNLVPCMHVQGGHCQCQAEGRYTCEILGQQLPGVQAAWGFDGLLLKHLESEGVLHMDTTR